MNQKLKDVLLTVGLIFGTIGAMFACERVAVAGPVSPCYWSGSTYVQCSPSIGILLDNQKDVVFREAIGNGTNAASMQAPSSLTADYTITLPTGVTAGVTTDQWTTVNGSGTLSFTNTTTRGKTIDGVEDETQLLIQSHSTQSTSTTPLLVERSDGTDIFAVVNDTANSRRYAKVSDGTATPSDATFQIGGYTAIGTNLHDAGYTSYRDNNNGGQFISVTTGGTFASRSTVAADTTIMQLRGYSWDSNSYELSAVIAMEGDGTAGNADVPSKIRLFTSPNGTATVTEGYRLDNAQNSIFGGNSTGDALISPSEGSTGSPSYSFLGAESTGMDLRAGTTNELALVTGGTERVRVLSDGEVVLTGTGMSSTVYLVGGATASTDIPGFFRAAAANTACGSTCLTEPSVFGANTGACLGGWNSDAGDSSVGCSDGTADTCLCIGLNQ